MVTEGNKLMMYYIVASMPAIIVILLAIYFYREWRLRGDRTFFAVLTGMVLGSIFSIILLSYI